MAFGPLLLVLLSALLHALWNALLKRERDTEAAAVGVLASATVLAALVALAGGSGAFPRPSAFTWAVAAGLGEGFYFLTLARALSRAPLGLAYTVARGGAIVLVWPLSVLGLGEPFTLLAAAGAALVLLGLAAAGIQREQRGGLGWSLACAISITAYHLAYKQSLAAGARASALFAVSLTLALALNLAQLPQARARLAVLFRTRAVPLLLGGALCTAAFLIFLRALADAGAGAVLTLRNTSVVFAQLLGLMLGERPRPRQLLGAALVVAGAILVGWPR
jgi:drug/metabolite transporter (DMT)-like permease